MSMGLNPLTCELHANERRQLLTHLLALDAEDRHLRFAHVLSDDGVRHYLEDIDLTCDLVFVVTDSDLAIIGGRRRRGVAGPHRDQSARGGASRRRGARR